MTPVLAGQLVVVLGGSAGIGLATARAARAEGAGVVITGRDPDRLLVAAQEIGARHSAAFDADDTAALALELAPVRVNLIAAGFVDTPLSARLLGDGLEDAGTNCGPPCRSAGSSARTTSPPWPSIS